MSFYRRGELLRQFRGKKKCVAWVTMAALIKVGGLLVGIARWNPRLKQGVSNSRVGKASSGDRCERFEPGDRLKKRRRSRCKLGLTSPREYAGNATPHTGTLRQWRGLLLSERETGLVLEPIKLGKRGGTSGNTPFWS